MENKKLLLIKVTKEDDILPVYEPPQVITYANEEILEKLDPIQTLSNNPKRQKERK